MVRLTLTDSIFVDVGAKAEGVIAKAELEEDGVMPELAEGDKIEARIKKIEGGAVVLTKVPAHQSLKKREELKEAHRLGLSVKGKVNGSNKGGFDVEVSGVRAFCPSSQIDLRPLKSDFYIGKTFDFRIVEFKDGGRNIVVSRRQILDEENRKKAEALLADLHEGDVRKGTITSLKDYGAFVDLGGLEGLVHLTEISHGHVVKPNMVLKLGEEVKVRILKIEDGKDGQKKISLSMKALEQDPWDVAKQQIREGEKITGRVARIQSFGAFVEVLPGVDALVHVSNMTLDRRLKNPADAVKEGDEIEATVISIDWTSAASASAW
ncbi:MAG: S1 RNA-binding domain-containing protein [Myxococcales bacterium]|nr:S1 RNA-binding domain-containing protein [Myxococcales bacterium]